MKSCTFQHIAIVTLAATLMISQSDASSQSHGYELANPQFDYNAAAIRNSERMKDQVQQYLNEPSYDDDRAVPIISPRGGLSGFIHRDPDGSGLITTPGGHPLGIIPPSSY